jgi:hypothetical protein
VVLVVEANWKIAFQKLFAPEYSIPHEPLRQYLILRYDLDLTVRVTSYQWVATDNFDDRRQNAPYAAQYLSYAHSYQNSQYQDRSR